jgi:hypothetical protein
MRTLLYLAVVALFALHQDVWYWSDSTLVFGVFPVGFFYHVLYCLAASLLLYLLIRFAWPHRLEAEADLPVGENGPPWR